MRPSFSYLDKADGKTREREAANEGAFVCLCKFSIFDRCHMTNLIMPTGGDSSQDEAEDEAKAITVTVLPCLSLIG